MYTISIAAQNCAANNSTILVVTLGETIFYTKYIFYSNDACICMHGVERRS